ncbi:hypothetical protein GCM10028806_48120 [Spirosoma terrae]|uniref:PQQ-binding-like beta-propeller repeat protein n=1 Tax=Spirosoma terrae TaxID=1968276 RepID=A0A6L9L3Y3_9BACT|nr:hypothetical protein [Spirosoma terrae]NDU93523.1 hypothetical protein [Spirosoma terrae]
MGKKYKKLFQFGCGVLVSLIQLSVSAQAPSIQWQRVINAPVYSNNLQAIKASNGGYALVYNGKVIRLSESGGILWDIEIQIPFPTTMYAEFITAIPDGSFMVLARNSYYWYLIRIENTGSVAWYKSFVEATRSTSTTERSFSSLIRTDDGGFLASDITQYGRNGTATILYKFDSEGNLTLTKSIINDYGNNARGSTRAEKIIQMNDGGYLLVGIATVKDLVTTSAWAARLTTQLDKIWQKNFSITEFDDVIQDPYQLGSYIAIGSESSSTTKTIKFDANGAISSEFTQSNRLSNSKSSLVKGAEGYTTVDVVNENSGDIRLQSLMSQGPSWAKRIGGSSTELIRSTVAADDGGYLLFGTTASIDGDLQGKTIAEITPWIVKISPPCNDMYYSTQAGNWDNPKTWSCGQIPTSIGVVHLNHAVVIPQSYSAKARQVIYDLPVQLKLEHGANLLLNP